MSEVDYVSEASALYHYRNGRVSRDAGEKKTICAIQADSSEGRQKRAWWLAGWHDRDMELDGVTHYKRLSARQVAKRDGKTKYSSKCSKHGNVDRWVASTKCTVCESVERRKPRVAERYGMEACR